MSSATQISIYTDGACSGNPGPGGYGLILMAGEHTKEVSEGFKLTTNNRMELLAVIKGLEMLKTNKHQVVIYSDSKYVIDSIEKKWVFGWAKKNFAGKKNADLWMRFLKVYPLFQVKFIWVKGHANNKFNNRCDELAVAASKSSKLGHDVVFETLQKSLKDNPGLL
jgi:ribonuclease HI